MSDNKEERLEAMMKTFENNKKQASEKPMQSKKANTNANKTSIKIDKDTKILFDEGVYRFRTNRIDFIQRIIEDWMKEKAPEIYVDYIKQVLYEQINKER
ncbi:hypothetical protein BUZ61_11770 [Staphylococcus nepalensis]|uniref:Uncharacterized protein n=1 Tax=Staphylococcus nepalensis TaxID=214473 RepID=A0A2T4S827_9STAP|nr:hypothetical protein [Staphylococcus nepalensis]PTK57815.1 hypothetical protein BUZ61_11770 [Staphylococcus nepalensis]